jgi:hypothetical protein
MKALSSLRLAATTHFFPLLLGFLLGLPLNLEVSSEGTLRIPYRRQFNITIHQVSFI